MDEQISIILNNANELLRADKLEEAIECLEKGAIEFPTSVDVLDRLGDILRENFRYPDALEVLTKAEALAPDHYNILMNLGCVLRHEGSPYDAMRVHEKLVSLYPEAAQAKRVLAISESLLFPDRAWQRVEKLLSNHPDDETTLFCAAQILQRLGRYTEVLDIVDPMLAADDDYTDVQLLKAAANRCLHRHDPWYTAARRAYELSPSEPETCFEMSKVWDEEKNLHQTIGFLDKSLRLHPHYIDAQIARADLLVLVNRMNDAQETYERVLQQAPWHGAAAGRYALFCARTGRQEVNIEALEAQATALPYGGLPFQLGVLFTTFMPNYQKAEHFLKLCIQCYPQQVEAHQRLADLYSQQKRFQEAALHFNTIAQLSPDWRGR